MSHAHDRCILTINTGSSSLKAGVYSIGASETVELVARAERIGHSESRLQITDAHGAPLLDQRGYLPDHDAALRALFAWFQGHRSGTAFDAVGHRVVHGGERYQEPQRITDDLIAALQQLVPLSPDHLPQALAAIQAARQVYPSIPQVACFDTTFCRTSGATRLRSRSRLWSGTSRPASSASCCGTPSPTTPGSSTSASSVPTRPTRTA